MPLSASDGGELEGERRSHPVRRLHEREGRDLKYSDRYGANTHPHKHPPATPADAEVVYELTLSGRRDRTVTRISSANGPTKRPFESDTCGRTVSVPRPKSFCGGGCSDRSRGPPPLPRPVAATQTAPKRSWYPLPADGAPDVRRPRHGARDRRMSMLRKISALRIDPAPNGAMPGGTVSGRVRRTASRSVETTSPASARKAEALVRCCAFPPLPTIRREIDVSHHPFARYHRHAIDIAAAAISFIPTETPMQKQTAQNVRRARQGYG